LLILDWDGTVMDSVGAIVGCMEATAERLGLAPIEEVRIRDVIGLGLDDTLGALVPEAGEELRQRVMDIYRELWFSGFRERQEPFEGSEEALAELARDEYLLAIATGKSRRGLERDLTATGFRRFFCATRTADEAFSKPHPEMVEDLLEETGSRAEESLVIGDTSHDVEMARNAGVGAVAVASGAQERCRLAAMEPLVVLGSLCDLKPWLDASGRGAAARRRGAAPVDSGDANNGEEPQGLEDVILPHGPRR